MSSLPSTPILGLHKFDDDDAMLASEVNENSDLIDLLPPTVCTSGTRPTTNLFSGRRIYETDTKRSYAYISNTWILMSSVPIMVKRRRTTDLTVNDGAVVNFDNFQTLEDSFNNTDLVHAAGVITISRPGLYVMSVTGEWQAKPVNGSGVGRRRFGIKVNGVAHYDGITDDMPASGQSLNSAFRQTMRLEDILATGDTIQPFAFNSSGENMTVDTGASFTVYRVF